MNWNNFTFGKGMPHYVSSHNYIFAWKWKMNTLKRKTDPAYLNDNAYIYTI